MAFAPLPVSSEKENSNNSRDESFEVSNHENSSSPDDSSSSKEASNSNWSSNSDDSINSDDSSTS